MAPRILFITRFNPLGPPPLAGSALRTLQIASALEGLGSLSIALVSTAKHAEDDLRRCRSRFPIAAVARMHHADRTSLRDRWRRLTDPDFHNTHGLLVEDAGRRALSRAIADHDVVWVHTVQLANPLHDVLPGDRTVLDVDDLYSALHASQAQCETAPLEKLRQRLRAFLWRRREARLPGRFAALVVCSGDDRTRIPGDRVHVVPNAFPDDTRLCWVGPEGPPRLGFIGAMGYIPNRVGVEWFLEAVWPTVRAAVPEARFRLVGRGSEGLRGLECGGVDVLGPVADADKEIGSWRAMVVPLLSGAGTRVKIAESFAKGPPVISTSIGAYGFHAETGRDLVIADSPEAYAEGCIRVLGEPATAAELSRNGRRLFEERYSWSAAAKGVRQAVESVLGEHPPAA